MTSPRPSAAPFVRRLGMAMVCLGAVSGTTLPPTGPAAAADWWTVTRPAPGPARSIGSPAAGCIAGATALPLDGRGYQVVRVSRNRYYGHPRLIRYVRDLAAAAAGAGLGSLYIGDLSQPRGGPALFGHASHQNGLDVDIWFNLAPKPVLTATRREHIDTPSMVVPEGLAVSPVTWTNQHATLLALAARSPDVERIFVHPAIKRQLCLTAAKRRDWLRKIRPWKGHNEHFHVRLTCSDGDADCVPGNVIPAGDGCDDLEWWFTKGVNKLPIPKPRKQTAPPSPRLPDACAMMLRAR